MLLSMELSILQSSRNPLMCVLEWETSVFLGTVKSLKKSDMSTHNLPFKVLQDGIKLLENMFFIGFFSLMRIQLTTVPVDGGRR